MQVLRLGKEGMPEEVEHVHHKCPKSRLDHLTSVVTSLTKRLVGKGMGQDMESEGDSVHNALDAAWNAIVLVI